MGDVAKGIKSFKKGMAEDPEADASPPKSIEPPGDPKRRVDTASKIETLS